MGRKAKPGIKTPFAERILACMNLMGLSRKELAKKAGIDESTLNSWFKAERKVPNAVNAVAVATVLNTSVEYLITGEER
ncbi:MAG: helix-turn-helix domain-containing protein [Treponema sp.]|nr:helix-turn-helix domain-containing protein [Treponema sp.]